MPGPTIRRIISVRHTGICSIWLAAAVLAHALCACSPRARLKVPPQSFDSANLGISVSLIAPIGILRLEPSVVYFAKVDDENGLFQPRLIPSDRSKDGHFYALNVVPGTYVAVGAQIVQDKAPGFTIYFSTGIMERTKTTVGGRELAFMGDFWVYMLPGLWGADAAQHHYAGLIAPPRLKPGLILSLIRGTYYRGILMRSRNDGAARDEFFRFAKEDLDRHDAAVPGVRVADRFFWTGPEGNLGLEIKARFQSQAMLERVLRPDMVIGSYKDKDSSKFRDWPLRDVLVSVNLNAAETAAVWRVSGPRPLIAAYAEGLARVSKKYPIMQDVDVHEVKFRATAE
ncbi:MAG: hypothetical protein HYV14_18095 [Elusimicrobia bacterium]|nr:hypothetical protein [Elusimicrobiota bacterium]